MRHDLLNVGRLSRQGHQAVANSEIGLSVDSKIVIIKQIICFVNATSGAVFHWDHCVLDFIILNGFK
jgi:hypothetical protein